MGSLITAIFFGWCFDRAQMVMSAPNYGALWNGFGCIDLVNRREARAPMAYRVLVPWLVALLKRFDRLAVYQTLKFISVVYAFWAVIEWIGVIGALVTFFILLVTVQFDYWDWAIELAGIALAMQGGLIGAAVGIALLALSRETWVLVAAAFYLVTGDLLGTFVLVLIGGGIFLAVRLIVGKRSLYCKRFMIRENWKLIKDIRKYNIVYYVPAFISLVLTALVIGAVTKLPAGWPIPLVILAAGWSMGKADEPRIFSAALPWAAVWLLEVM